MLHYDEFIECFDGDLNCQYYCTHIQNYLTYDDFCVQEYEGYVFSYVKAYRETRLTVLPHHLDESMSYPAVETVDDSCEIPY